MQATSASGSLADQLKEHTDNTETNFEDWVQAQARQLGLTIFILLVPTYINRLYI